MMPDMIHSLLLPVHGKMLLPHATVAEVVAYQKAEPVSHAPAWLAGMLLWRGLRIPLIFFEGACGESLPVSPPAQQKIVVLKTLGNDPELPFIALVMQGIPRALRVDKEMVAPDSHDVTAPLILKHINVQGQAAYIPNLDALESAVKLALVTIN
ncbi:MAG: chemotaxis protein CheW [Gammaproteobacteria bacterium]|nr:chemotaxis protein CheW [Gammaproteobacteria bacterium]